MERKREGLWDNLGAIFDHLGTFLAPLKTICVYLESFLGASWPIWEPRKLSSIGGGIIVVVIQVVMHGKYTHTGEFS